MCYRFRPYLHTDSAGGRKEFLALTIFSFAGGTLGLASAFGRREGFFNNLPIAFYENESNVSLICGPDPCIRDTDI